MTGKIYSSFFLSIFFHSLVILLLIFGIKNSVNNFKNPTYVTLIQESGKTQINSIIQKDKAVKEIQPIKQKNERFEKSIEKTHKITKTDEELLQERIAALRAKKRILEKANQSSAVMPKVMKSQGGSLEFAGSKNSKGKDVSASYLALISGLIRQNWNIPDTVPKNLEAVLSVRILPNGQIIIEGFEKHSGNTLFDSSVIRAIKNSSPLPPPKDEVIVGLRFKP